MSYFQPDACMVLPNHVDETKVWTDYTVINIVIKH